MSEDLDLMDVELDESTNQEEVTNQDEVTTEVETPQTVKLGDDEVDLNVLSEVYKKHKDGESFTAETTRRAQEMAEERRAFEAERRQWLQEREEWFKSQQQPQKTELTLPDEIADDPALAAIYKENQELKQQFSEFMNTQKQDKETQAIQEQHRDLAGRFEDYDAAKVEDLIIKGNPFENAYLAEKFRSFQAGDKEALLSMIPEDVKQGLIKQGKDEMLEDLRKKKELRNNVSTPQPTRTALSQVPIDKPKSYNEAAQQAASLIKERGMSLIED
jgi:hypothetical protein